MLIQVKKGLDIPINNKPQGDIRPLHPFHVVALHLDAFEEISFTLHVKLGDEVKIGQPLAESKHVSGKMFVSPASGIITNISRGLKRRLISIEIRISEKESFFEQGSLNHQTASREEIVSHLMKGGIFPHLRRRPFDLLAEPTSIPKAIFVSAVDTLPFSVPPELHVRGHETEFQIGLQTLTKLTSGKVHLVFRKESTCKAFTEAKSVEKHIVTGPHPSGNVSTHIHFIHPLLKVDDLVWTLNINDVIAVGKMMHQGRYHYERVLSLAGNGFQKEKVGFYQGRMGCNIAELSQNALVEGPLRLISGDPLVGFGAEKKDFLGFYHTTLSALVESAQRESFHFFRWGLRKYSSFRAYASGRTKSALEFEFTTNQHGEERAFIDGSIYDKVMPLKVPTMFLIKALLAEDYELAHNLGLLEVCAEDFALPAFICPSKIEMVEIVKEGLLKSAKELGLI